MEVHIHVCMLDRWMNESPVIMTGPVHTELDEVALIFFLKERRLQSDQLSPLILKSDEGYIKCIIIRQIPKHNTHYIFKNS